MRSKEDQDWLDALWGRPVNYKFNEQELAHIKKHLKKHSYKVKYALYKPVSSKGQYIGFFIDSTPNATRRSGVENHWEWICERDLTNIEYDEICQNYGRNNRRFHTWMYDVIERLQEDDKKYHIETPEVFVKLCKDKGYTGDVQAIIEFENYEEV